MNTLAIIMLLGDREAQRQSTPLSSLMLVTGVSVGVGHRALDDDLATIRATGEVFNALDDAILAIGKPRLRALVRLRAQGRSYNRLVERTGLS